MRNLILSTITLTLLLLAGAGQRARAFAPETYAAHSRLAAGRWLKVSVEQTGMHVVTDKALRAAGFSDPEKVKVYGYGAERLPMKLDAATLRDDLPETPSVYLPGKGVCFYASGPEAATFLTASATFRPEQNPYTLKGYYFLSDAEADTPRLAPETADRSALLAPDDAPTGWMLSWAFHELEQTSPGKAGFMLVGEDFKFTPRRSFELALPDAADASGWLEVSFVYKSATGGATLLYTANGKELPTTSADRFGRTTDDHAHGVQLVSQKAFDVASDALKLSLNLSTTASVALANLDYIAATYRRTLAFPSQGSVTGVCNDRRDYSASGAGETSRLWDVTDPLRPAQVAGKAVGGSLVWQNPAPAPRRYVLWRTDGSLPEAKSEGAVTNQDLHALRSPDMVIFTPAEWRDQAERLAQYHRDSPDALRVLVLTPREVYNEFASGSPDAMAFRKCLKMFYDRGAAAAAVENPSSADSADRPLRYALLMARPTFDNRAITPEVRAQGYPNLASWHTDKAMSDNDCYTSDDPFGFLADGSGANLGTDRLSIAVGRLPFVSPSNAAAGVDKLLKYATDPGRGNWRNTVLLIADDGDAAAHLQACEDLAAGLDQAGETFVKKIYTDAYELVSGQYPGARSQFFRDLDEGVLWWNFIGHASATNLTAEGLMNYSDLDKVYLRRLPLIYAATCNFMRWDDTKLSGAELMFHTENGGTIGVVSANRPVYIDKNGYLSEAMGQEMTRRRPDGTFPTLGEVVANAKNNRTAGGGRLRNDTNKLRYALMGDPAMPTALPSPRLVVDEVNGKALTDYAPDEEPPTLMARQQATIGGYVADPSGRPMADFEGLLASALFDAEQSVTTRGNGDRGVESVFDQHGGRLFVGSDSIRAGRFTIRLSMPSEVENNYRPACLNLYAYRTNIPAEAPADTASQPSPGRLYTEASGLFRDFYVYGTDETAAPDTVAPVIDYLCLNHTGFKDGDFVNPSPMLLASVTDNRAINLSTAGIGHQMALYLDEGEKSLTDVCDFYTPFSDGTPGGTIAYPLGDLKEGPHTLRLRVWDTAVNSTSATIRFNVSATAAPTLLDVYTDANPAEFAANFYVTHDRPDQEVAVTIEVFDMLGRPVWQRTQRGRSDMFSSVPVPWDLTTSSGARVSRGIYLYRAVVTDALTGASSSTKVRRLAVAAQ